MVMLDLIFLRLIYKDLFSNCLTSEQWKINNIDTEIVETHLTCLSYQYGHRNNLIDVR